MPNKLLKCCGCKERFDRGAMFKTPAGYFHSFECATSYARRKQQRVQHKADKERIKTKAEWAKEAQASVNSYIRARDHGKPCISCDQASNIGRRHASHYRSVGACTQLRFNTFNIHASCAQCNSKKSGNILEYRIRLIKKIGQEKVDWLETQNKITRYDIEYLKRIKRIFAKRARVINNWKQIP